MRSVWLFGGVTGAVATLLFGCTTAPPPAHSEAPAARPAASSSTPAPAPSAAKTELAPLRFIEDDIVAAEKLAKLHGKLLFVDAWAPWCHTCLSMQNYVFGDPGLRPYGDRLVFASIDTDRDENAVFVDRYAIKIWPTFVLIDPKSQRILGYWQGSASVAELRELFDQALDARDALAKSEISKESATGRLLAAKAAFANREFGKAAELYAGALELGDDSWPRRNAALFGQLQSLYQAERWLDCATLGMRHLGEIRGASLPADYARTVFECSAGMKAGREQAEVRNAALNRLRAVTDSPPVGATPDDRADALATLADCLLELGDKPGAKAANQRRLEIMENAARAAPTPEIAATYDYGRASAYMALGRGDEAVSMLKERERQLADSYEPSARLASALADLKRWPEALQAIDRALPKSYGPRKLRYLALKARIQVALRDFPGAIASLEQEVEGYRALAQRPGYADKLKDAEKRLAQVQALTGRVPKAKPKK